LEEIPMSEQNPWEDFQNPVAPTARDASAPVVVAPARDAAPWESFPKSVAPYQAIPGVTPAPPDKYRQAAIEDRQRFIDAGAENVLPEGYTARLGKGVGLNWTDELMAGALSPIEAIKRGVSIPEAYRYTKAAQDLSAEKAAENTAGPLGAGAEVLGGLATGAGAFGGTRAATIPFTSRALPEAIAAPYNYGRNVLKAGTIGAAAGAGEGNTFDERFKGAEMGGLLGAGIGAALPIVTSVVGPTLRILQTPRLRDPENIATEQLAKVYRDSGESMPDVVQRMANAQAAGQTDYTLADALGKEGARKLAAQAKVPGEARDQITDFLTARDLNMPIRTGTEVGKALGAPTTAAAAEKSLVQQAETASAPLYSEAKQTPTWSPRIQQFLDDPIASAGLKQGVEVQRLRSAGTDTPFNPKDAAITHFNEAGDPVIGGVPNMQTLHTLKVGLDKMIEGEVNPATFKLNARGAALADYKNRLLAEIDAINPAYREARAAYRGPMEVKDAVQQGRDMVTRGRPADTIPAFAALPTAEQQGVRIGVADKVREQLERTGNFPAYLRQKVPKGSQELDALSLYQGPRQIDPVTQQAKPDQLRQFLTREEEMQKTSKAAGGGSSTAENLADITSAPGGAELVGAIGSAVHGNPFGAARNIYELGLRVAKGESEAQRSAIARALMAREPSDVQSVADRITAYNLRRSGYNPWTGNVRLPEGQ
jgi:hypothetical protein